MIFTSLSNYYSIAKYTHSPKLLDRKKHIAVIILKRFSEIADAFKKAKKEVWVANDFVKRRVELFCEDSKSVPLLERGKKR